MQTFSLVILHIAKDFLLAYSQDCIIKKVFLFCFCRQENCSLLASLLPSGITASSFLSSLLEYSLPGVTVQCYLQFVVKLYSAAMFCFYSYVILSGGNPPPKKLKASTSGAY